MKSMNKWRVVGLLLAVSGAYANLVAPRSLVDLQQNADLIIVGAANAGTQAGNMLSFTLQVSRVVKGDAAITGTVIPVDWVYVAGTAGTKTGAPSPATGNGLWFLQRSSSGWHLLPVTQGNVPLSQTFIPLPSGPILGSYAYVLTASLTDKVASEVSAAIENVNGGGPEWAYLHFGLLDQLHSPVTQVLYQRMSASASTPQKILGLSGLIRGGSAAALNSAFQAASAFGAYPLESGVLLWSIQNEFRATDANSVAALGRLTVDSKNPIAFRIAAAHALAAIHTIDALPYLATLVDDTNADLRVESIGGLGAFANGLPVQTTAAVPGLGYLQLAGNAPYKTTETVSNFALGKHAIGRNEGAYVSFWKTWWLQERTKLGY